MLADATAQFLPLFAQDLGVGAFLTPELVGKIAGGVLTLGAGGSFGWWLARRTYAQKLQLLRKKVEHYQDLHETAANERDRLTSLSSQLQGDFASSSAQLTELTGRYEAVLKAAHAWRTHAIKCESALKGWKTETGRLRDQVATLTAEKLRLESEALSLSTEGADRGARLARSERRMRQALRLEGQLWAAKATQGRPRFRELGQRQRAIISVLNLKGGVGKTTITAHLGAALARRGYRVLVIDLDLQGSLTSMLLPQDKLNALFADQRLLQHFLSKSCDDRRTKITSFAQPVFEVAESGGRLSIVGTTDNLAYAELNLTVRWLLQTGTRDTRFLLRKALHLLGVGRKFDVVLLDCPPVVNISCVNALAASDYLLIPTSMSRKSLERIPVLLGRLLKNEKFNRYVNHNLRVLGIVANRVWRESFSAAEQSEWDRLATKCRDIYGHPVKRFESIIPQQSKAIQDSEAEFCLPRSGSRLATLFDNLALEVEQELPSECRRLAKTHR